RLEETEGAEAAKEFREAVKKKKLKGALRDHLFGGDEETMGAVMTYVTTMAAVDQAARVDASILAADVLEQLDSKTLTLYHEARDMLRGRLRYVDPDDIEGMLEHFAKYGLPDDESARLARSAREFWENRNKIAAAYMETVEEAAARGGAVAEGHIRFYGHLDTDTGEIVWRTSAPTAIPVSEALRRWDELPDDTLIEVYHSTTPELAERMLREGVKKGAKKKADYSTWLTGEGFYVGDDPDRLRFLFGRQGPETPGTPLGIIVRKGDLADSPEALRMGLDMREALRDPLVGAQILDDLPAERIRIIEVPDNVTAPIAGDPYFVDIAESELRSVLGDQADAVLRGEGNLPPTLTRRYRLRSELSNSRFPRLSEAASVRAFKPEKIEKLKELARRHNSLREAELARIFADVDPKMLSQYIYETLPTFGN